MSEAVAAGRILNRAELASLCDVSLPTVDGWVRKGCPYLERGSKGREWRFDAAAVIEWRVAHSVEEALSGYQDESGQITREEADRRRAVANAISAEVTTDELLKSVVSRSDAEADMAAFCVSLKTALASACAKIAARATSMKSAPEIQVLCEAELNRAFDAAEAELITRWVEAERDDDGSGEDQPPPAR